jgi:hypothetical protein
MENKIILFFILLFSQLTIKAQNLYVKVQSETVHVYQGKKVTIVEDMFFKSPENSLITHFSKPDEYYYLSNLKGEAKLYYPSTNSVKVINDLFLSSKNNILFYFVNNNISDMGLQEGGFTLLGSKQEGNQNISEWKPPMDLASQFLKVEFVHENYLPLYMAYYSAKGNVFKKIYYTNYQQYNTFVLPTRIVEIEYKSPQDSVIHNQILKNVQTAYTDFDPMFDFKIPENAKLSKN